MVNWNSATSVCDIADVNTDWTYEGNPATANTSLGKADFNYKFSTDLPK